MRLTEKKDNGHWILKDVSWDELKPGVVLTKEIWEKLYGALWKLKDYEDTGLMPNEVTALNVETQKDAEEALKEIRRWIPVTERLPEPETYILVSFDNFTLPDIATYRVDRVDDDGSGAFYQGDEDYTYLYVGFFVNAWMPLPEPYRAEVEEN